MLGSLDFLVNPPLCKRGDRRDFRLIVSFAFHLRSIASHETQKCAEYIMFLAPLENTVIYEKDKPSYINYETEDFLTGQSTSFLTG